MKILIAGYPKSGNTWLNYMVAYGTGSSYVDYDNKENTPKSEQVRALVAGGPAQPFKSEYDLLHKTHLLPSELDIRAYDKILYIIRDPRDVSVSFFYFRYFFQANKKGKVKIEKKTKLPVLGWFFLKYYLMKTVVGTTKSWAEHVKLWKAVPSIQFVRYEDLINARETALVKVFESLELNRTTEELSDIYKKFSFEVLAGANKTKDEKTSFYRKGIVGDHKNHMNLMDHLAYKLLFASSLKENNYFE